MSYELKTNPIYKSGALVVLKGNIAPDGCVMKVTAMDKRFLKHIGSALVFDSYPDMKAAIDDENIEATADTVLILRNAGPLGGPGMPEWGMLPIPKKLVKQGVRDMLRISDQILVQPLRTRRYFKNIKPFSNTTRLI